MRLLVWLKYQTSPLCYGLVQEFIMYYNGLGLSVPRLIMIDNKVYLRLTSIKLVSLLYGFLAKHLVRCRKWSWCCGRPSWDPRRERRKETAAAAEHGVFQPCLWKGMIPKETDEPGSVAVCEGISAQYVQSGTVVIV